MNDDLVERLRSKIIVHTDAAVWMLEAADHIEQLAATNEELEAERDDYANRLMQADNTYTEMHLHIEELEAKLAKAVEALEFIDGKISWEINPSNYDHGQVCDMNADWCEIGNHATTTLAELKGQDDE